MGTYKTSKNHWLNLQFLFITFLTSSLGINAFSQSPALNCRTGCTSNDVQITRAYLKTKAAVPVEITSSYSCSIGAQIETELYLDLTTSTPRKGVSVYARLVNIDDATDIIATVSECFSGRLSGVNTVKFTTPITWECGDRVKLDGVFIAWGTGNTEFCISSAEQCPATSSKCWLQGPNDFIPVVDYPCTPATFGTAINSTKCAGESTSFSFTFTAAANSTVTSTKWQISNDNGTSWSDLTINSPYSVNSLSLPTTSGTSTLSINSVSGLNGKRYRLYTTSTSTSNNTCSGTSNGATLTIKNNSTLPTVSSPVVYCKNATTIALTATGSNLLWYADATGGTGSSTAPTPSSASVGSTTYYVSQTVTGECESGRAAIVVTVKDNSSAPSVSSPVIYCRNQSTVQLSATGTNLLWYSSPSGGTGSSTAPTPSSASVGSTTYYVSQTEANKCESGRASIVVTINDKPVAPVVMVNSLPTLCNTNPGGSIKICNPVVGYIYKKVGDANGITAVSGQDVIFTGIAAGSNPSFTVSLPASSGGCTSDATSACDAVTSCTSPASTRNSNSDVQENNVITQQINIPVDRKLGVKAFPNPYNDVIRFVINSEESGIGRLELFNMLGQKVKTVYQGRIAEGVQNFEISVPAQHRSTLIYVMTLNGKQFTGKLLNSSK